MTIEQSRHARGHTERGANSTDHNPNQIRQNLMCVEHNKNDEDDRPVQRRSLTNFCDDEVQSSSWLLLSPVSSTCVNRCNDDQSSSVQKSFEQKAVDRPVHSLSNELFFSERKRDRSIGRTGDRRRRKNEGHHWLWIPSALKKHTHTRAREESTFSCSFSSDVFQEKEKKIQASLSLVLADENNLWIERFSIEWKTNYSKTSIHQSRFFFSRYRTERWKEKNSIDWLTFRSPKKWRKQTAAHRPPPSIGRRWNIRSPSFRKNPTIFGRFLFHMLINTRWRRGSGSPSSSARRKGRRHKALSGKTSLLFYSITTLAAALNIIGWEDAGEDRLELSQWLVFSFGRKSMVSFIHLSVRKEYGLLRRVSFRSLSDVEKCWHARKSFSMHRRRAISFGQWKTWHRRSPASNSPD